MEVQDTTAAPKLTIFAERLNERQRNLLRVWPCHRLRAVRGSAKDGLEETLARECAVDRKGRVAVLAVCGGSASSLLHQPSASTSRSPPMRRRLKSRWRKHTTSVRRCGIGSSRSGRTNCGLRERAPAVSSWAAVRTRDGRGLSGLGNPSLRNAGQWSRPRLRPYHCVSAMAVQLLSVRIMPWRRCAQCCHVGSRPRR